MPRTTTSDVTSLSVGRALRRARLDCGISQQELANRLGVSPPYLSTVENGRSNTTIGQLTTIADALGVILEIEFVVPESTTEPDIPTAPSPAVLG
jgi:transcriptional regulator with XRE-family HTH domain